MTVGVFQPGDSAVHRATPGAKLGALAGFAILLSLSTNIVFTCVALGAVGCAWALAGLFARDAMVHLKPIVWMLGLLFVFQVFASGFGAALQTALTLIALVLAASLVSKTTRMDDMLDTLTMALSPFARIGLKGEQVAFALVFAIRLVPFVSAVGTDTITARVARGATRYAPGALIPIVIRLMRETDALSEALVARGFGQA